MSIDDPVVEHPLIGRTYELGLLRTIVESGKAEFIAVHGRRRVGKTFLIRRFFNDIGAKAFYVMGERDAGKSRQLALFQKSLETAFYGGERLPRLTTWSDAFEMLVAGVRQQVRSEPSRPILLFLDELPWLSTPKAGLLSAIDHSWNTELSLIAQVKLVVCGSAASWMIRKVLQAKGGLFGRVTRTLALKPFCLAETRDFLLSRNYALSNQQITELYMILGGIPYYLEQLQRGRSVSQNVSALCFGEGALAGEFDRLMHSLYEHAQSHISILTALAARHSGLTRQEICGATGISAGGRLDLWLDELEKSHFVARIDDFSRKRSSVRYRLVDEFTLFHLTWMKNSPGGVLGPHPSENYWGIVCGTPAHASWSGYAFENLCLKHLRQVKSALGIGGIVTSAGSWQYQAAGSRSTKQSVPSGEGETELRGAQIDLLLDRADGVISMCEAKYAQKPFVVDKETAEILERKIRTFKSVTATAKSIFLSIISPHGVAANEHSRRLVSNVVTMDDLFRP